MAPAHTAVRWAALTQVLRKPFTAEEMGARLGAPVGGYYGYLAGVDNGMVRPPCLPSRSRGCKGEQRC